ncbi:MAG: hypothetical protein OXT67_08880 [Zetaproteobacteria bacterium]|nr:hypothetical protein [Zetaproteobacteria bacterium]
MKHIRCTLLILTTLLTSQCVSLRSVSITQIPKQRQQEVQAEAKKWIVLGFSFNNEYVNDVVTSLKKQCPFGKVSGILTKHYVTSYLLVHKHAVDARGFCLQKRG